jgi:pimeloyl-ACP methyl ester carboxylesterase
VPLIDLHGTRLRFREAGRDRAGPPLLFIHGAGASSAIWLGLMHRLARTRRCVALDLPGHGRSEGAVASIDEMRDAVGAFAAKACLGPSLLVGHSMGGLVAQAAALAWPDKIAGLAFVATSARIKVAQPLLDLLGKDFARWPAFLAEGAYSPETPCDTRRRGAGIACAASQAQTLADFRAVGAVDYRDKLGAITAPTLVVTGAHDLMTPPKFGASLAAGIRGARLVELPRCGHFPMHEQPDALAAAITGFRP